MTEKDKKVLNKVVELLQEEYGDQHLERTGVRELNFGFVSNTLTIFREGLEKEARQQANTTPATRYLYHYPD